MNEDNPRQELGLWSKQCAVKEEQQVRQTEQGRGPQGPGCLGPQVQQEVWVPWPLGRRAGGLGCGEEVGFRWLGLAWETCAIILHLGLLIDLLSICWAALC